VVEHRAFPLRSVPDPSATFRGTYREDAWRRCARLAEPDGIAFTPWPHADHYPNWSLPALEAARCVARQGAEAFARVHLKLYEGFFTRSLNIADPRAVAALVAEAVVDTDRFIADYRAGRGREEVLADWKTATEDRVSAIPTVIFPETGRALVGLAEATQYRAAIEDAARC
jgi:predicted DsbA family dithiol-disulfide isomerase